MDAFGAEVAQEDFHLARACLLLARDVRPHVDADAYLARFEPWTRRVAELAPEVGFPRAAREVLAVEEVFRGHPPDYYDPDNSYLDAVLDRRVGIPITLAVVWLEVARRLHEPLVAVGLPGHFLVRHEDVLLDPYHGGGFVTEADCQGILDRIYGGSVRLQPTMLAATSDRDVLARVLANLKGAYVRAQDARAAIRIEDRILQVNPYAFTEYRDRGLLRRAAGDAAGARADLQRYVDALPAAPDADAVRRLIERLGR